MDTTLYGQTILREGQVYTVSGVTGMTEINGLQVYPKHTSISSSLLFLDSDLTQGVDTTASGSYSSDGTMTGLAGSQNYFTLVAQKKFPVSNDITIQASVSWREIDQ